MRLWNKDLIDVLPRQQLLGQWRELCAIMRNIEAKHDCGGITDDEWQCVEDRCREVLGDRL